MLRERPELFYPVYYIAPQHYSPWQASSSSFVQHQVSSQQYYASGYVKSLGIIITWSVIMGEGVTQELHGIQLHVAEPVWLAGACVYQEGGVPPPAKGESFGICFRLSTVLVFPIY